MTLRDRWVRWLCRWRKHVLTENRESSLVGTSGVVSSRQVWKVCRCGERSSGVMETRIIQPYPEVRR